MGLGRAQPARLPDSALRSTSRVSCVLGNRVWCSRRPRAFESCGSLHCRNRAALVPTSTGENESEPMCSSMSATTAHAAPSIAKSQITEYRFAGCYLGGSQTKLDGICMLSSIRSVESGSTSRQIAVCRFAGCRSRKAISLPEQQITECRLQVDASRAGQVTK